MKRFSVFIFAVAAFLMCGNAQKAKVTAKDYVVDAGKNVVVSKTIEDLGLSSEDLLSLARKYFRDAYKETKYKIVQDDKEKQMVVGQGRYENFLVMNAFPNAYYLCADFYVRIDIKEGRARISLYVNKYSGQRQNGNITGVIDDPIADFAPLNTKNSTNKRLYSKAFPTLVERLKNTLAEVEQTIRQNASAYGNSADW